VFISFFWLKLPVLKQQLFRVVVLSLLLLRGRETIAELYGANELFEELGNPQTKKELHSGRGAGTRFKRKGVLN
jgi:hypothetical protein